MSTMRSSAAPEPRYLVISADGHDGPPHAKAKLLPYLEAKHHDGYMGATTDNGVPFDRDGDNPYPAFFDMWGMDAEWIEQTVARYWRAVPPLDPAGRVAEMERCGVAAELLITNAAHIRADAELNRAVQDAHFRWLIEHDAQAHGRFASVVAPDWTDRDRALGIIRDTRKHGLFGGVTSPDPNHLMNRAAMDLLPPLVDPHWYPLWELCEELNLPIICHGVHATVHRDHEDPQLTSGFASMETSYFSLRPLFLLMAAGILDKHPGLKICFIEHDAGIVPGMLRAFDRSVAAYSASRFRRRLNMKPSEYWQRHAFIGTPFLDPYAIERRDEIGVGKLMWGADYPHPEGAWPYIKPALRYAVGGLPDEDIAAILGGNALKVWDFDEPMLRKVADRIGPTASELAEPLPRAEIPPFTTLMAFGEPRRVEAIA